MECWVHFVFIQCTVCFVFSSSLLISSSSLILLLYAHATQQNLTLSFSHTLSRTHSLTCSHSVSDLKRHNPKLRAVRILLSRHLLFIFAFPRSASFSFHSFSLIFPFQSLLFSVTSPSCAFFSCYLLLLIVSLL